MADISGNQEYVKYLLEGSGAEQHFAKLKDEIDKQSSVSRLSNILDDKMLNKSWEPELNGFEQVERACRDLEIPVPPELKLADSKSLMPFLQSLLLEIEKRNRSIQQNLETHKSQVSRLEQTHSDDQLLIDKMSKELHELRNNKGATNTLPLENKENLDISDMCARLQEENELLRLKLLSADKRHKEIPKEKQSTRELIQRDKKAWQYQHLLQDESPEKVVEILGSVSVQLGVKNIEQLPAAIERISMAVRLIPQMKHFVHEIIAIVKTFSPQLSQTSQTSISETKLDKIVAKIRGWADAGSRSDELETFAWQVHQLLNIKKSSASLELCLEEIKQTANKSPKQLYADIPVDAAQQAVGHFRDLFEIKNAVGVLPRMNELYVFWAEVNDALRKLKTLLAIDDHVQPGTACNSGRVLNHAIEAISKYKDTQPSPSQLPPDFLG